jgi:hypothetical protein
MFPDTRAGRQELVSLIIILLQRNNTDALNRSKDKVIGTGVEKVQSVPNM